MVIFRLSRKHRLLRKRGYFDDQYYLLNNPDVRKADMDPLSHYVLHGWREGRNPSALFDVRYYLENYPDVRNAGIDPLWHYMEHGRVERRNPNALFDVGYYLDSNPDVAESGMDPLEHYLRFGIVEGRTPCKYYNEMAHDKNDVKLALPRTAKNNTTSGLLDGALRRAVAYSQKLLQLLCMAIKNPSLIVNAFENLKTNGFRSTINEIHRVLNKVESGQRQAFEPDERYCAIVQALEGYFKNHTPDHLQGQEHLLLITHDFARAGAPLLLLNIAKHLKEVKNKNIFIVILIRLPEFGK